MSIAILISSASCGFVLFRCGMILDPLHDVSIRDFSGLMKQPRLSPSSLNFVRRNDRSVSGTVQLISSTQEKMCVIPPYPSSPVLPLKSRCCARLSSRLFNGCSTRLRTREAKVDDKGHPWLTPSFIAMEVQSVLSHLK